MSQYVPAIAISLHVSMVSVDTLAWVSCQKEHDIIRAWHGDVGT